MKIKTWMLAAIRPLVIIMVFCSACVFTSCSSNDIDPVTPSEEEEYTGIPLVILDTDIGSSTDDLFALEMLPLTVINAVEGNDLFMLSERGIVGLNDDGSVIFTPSATDNSRFQMPGDDAWRSAMLEIIRNVNKILINNN